MKFENKINPLVSIIMNCHNGEEYLENSLNTVLQQSYSNYELIFFDNHSNDCSAKIFKRFQNNKFKYYSTNSKVKLYDARNLALQYCKGEIITFLDTDDLWKTNKLEVQVSSMLKENNIGVAYSYYEIYDNNKKKIKLKKPKSASDITNHLLKDYDIALVSIAIRSELLKIKNIRFNSNYNIIGDFDMMLKLSLLSKFQLIKQNLCTYRVHSQSETSKKYDQLISEMKSWYKENSIKDLSQKKNYSLIRDKIIYFESCQFLKNKNYYKFFENFFKFKRKVLFIKIFIKFLANRLK